MKTTGMTDPVQPDRASRQLVVLFLCTYNATRSIMAEALLNHLGNGRMRACSAGDRIVRELHPLTLDCLARHGVPSAGLHSKSWELFFGLGAPPLDYIITVCDDSRADRGAAGAARRAHVSVRAARGNHANRAEPAADAVSVINPRVNVCRAMEEIQVGSS